MGLIITAYDIKVGALLERVPAWAADVRYNVEAKPDQSTDEELSKLSGRDFDAEKHHMIQLLLADRFHLRVHYEKRMGTAYELVATPRATTLMIPIEGDMVKTISTCDPHYIQKGIEVESRGCPFPTLLSQLEQELGTTITDRTEMKGMFAYHLAYNTSLDTPPDVEHFPDLAPALREQLGLELKRTKAPVMFLVVDHADPPTPN